jgi:dCTP deaminase
MLLNGDEIIARHNSGDIEIIPWDEKMVMTNSYNVRLHPMLREYEFSMVDPREKNPTRDIEIPEDGMILEKGRFLLGATEEINNNHANDLVPFLDGRSSIGRLGLMIHITAGAGDVGFCGRWTLEIVAAIDVKIYRLMPIGQLKWFRTTPTARRYTGKYNQTKSTEGAVASLLHQEFVKR